MNRKIGKFKLWQLLAIGGAVGLALYEYEKHKSTTAEATPEGSELVASSNNPLGGGSGGEGAGVGGSGTGSPTVGPTGEPGAPGPAGTPGPAGASVEQFTPAQVEKLTALAEANNNPSQGSKPNAPLAKGFPLTNPLTGQKYKIVKEHGATIHVYQNGHKVVVSKKKTPAKHSNPQHKVSHAAPVKPISHARPKKQKHKAKARA